MHLHARLVTAAALSLTSPVFTFFDVIQETPTAVAFWREVTEAMVSSPFKDGFYFETPGLTLETATQRSFEAMLVQAEPFETEDRGPFSQFILSAAAERDGVVSFASIGNAGTLVSPHPVDGHDYGHLLSFLSSADEEQIDALWRHVRTEWHKRLIGNPDTPLYVSTSGKGVAYLHVRLFNVPRYYSWQPYKDGHA